MDRNPFVCSCGCSTFFGHQVVHMDIKVNGFGAFEENMTPDSPLSDIFTQVTLSDRSNVRIAGLNMRIFTKKINLSPQIERRGIMPELLSPDSTSVTPELCTMMCLSTVHLRHGTMKSLENCEYDGLPSYRKPVPGDDENSYGAFVCIGDIDKDELFALPRELKTIWEYAHSHGIWWVMFDADAPVCAQFEQFQADWYNNSNMGGANNAL